ncbi:MAG: preprotein translocase subunit SecG [Arcobacter sp.]|nr:MAG: preprotein translocase subunit SecG [Arcobacter sp.]
MTSTLLIVQFILAILITIAILLQKSSSMGLGAYSGSNDSMFGAKGPANFLTKLTFSLGILIVLNTLYLGYLYNQENSKSVVDNVEINSLIPSTPVDKTPLNSAPAAPTK